MPNTSGPAEIIDLEPGTAWVAVGVVGGGQIDEVEHGVRCGVDWLCGNDRWELIVCQLPWSVSRRRLRRLDQTCGNDWT